MCLEDEDGKQHRGGEDLIMYGTPGVGKGTVIYHNPFQARRHFYFHCLVLKLSDSIYKIDCVGREDGNPVQRPEDVQDFLKSSRIDRVCSGHQPHGQTPTVVRHPRTGLLVITADTSRSDAKASKIFNPADNRGMVYSSVWLRRDTVEIEGPAVAGA